MIHKNRCNRRFMTHVKATRKKAIYTAIYGIPENIPDGEFRKGKIHCSCARCAAKTNTKINRSRGPVSTTYVPTTHGARLTGTNHRLGKKNYKHSEIKEIIDFRQALAEMA